MATCVRGWTACMPAAACGWFLADSDANGTDDCYAMDYTGDGIADDLDADNTPDHIAYTFNESDPPSARVFTPAGGLTLNFSRVAQPERRQDAFNSLSYGFTQGAPSRPR